MLNKHCETLLNDFREKRHIYEIMSSVLADLIRGIAEENGISIVAVETRVKAESSLEGKLKLKGYKYKTILDITDLVGARMVTFYSDEVDKFAAVIEKKFTIDWYNSTDKRQRYEYDRFGYMSLHYICRVPKELYYDEKYPEINEIEFELQMRTALQHVWASIQHDIGYKSAIEVPKRYLRNFSCLAGLLEIADREFTSMHSEINGYRKKVDYLLKDGRFEDVDLDADSFRTYLEFEPFRTLNKRIAAINKADIYYVDLMVYLPVLENIGITTLGKLEQMRNECSDAAYNLALHQIGGTDFDIISSSQGLHYICVVYILENGGGVDKVTEMYDILYGKRERNRQNAARVCEHAEKLLKK